MHRFNPTWDKAAQPDNVRLDEIVPNVLEVPVSWREELAEASTALVRARIEKARSVRK